MAGRTHRRGKRNGAPRKEKRFARRGRPTALDNWIFLAKASWGDVLEILGKDPVFGAFDQKPYEIPDPESDSGEWARLSIAHEKAMMKTRKSIQYLSTPDVLRIHDEMIDAYGGDHGILDQGKVDSALDRIMYSRVGGQDAMPSIIEKAAFLMHSILRYHPFADGQKRTGLSSAFVFLGLNGYYLWSRSPLDEVHFAIHVARGEFEVADIAKWLAMRIAPGMILQDQGIIDSSLRAVDRRRQCTVCGKRMRVNQEIITCPGCHARYRVSLKAAVWRRTHRNQRELFITESLHILGEG